MAEITFHPDCDVNNHLSSIVTRQSVVIADIASPHLTPVSPRRREVVRPAGHLYFSVYLGEQGGGKVCVVFPPCPLSCGAQWVCQ